jgi:3-isopropylmalate/(R)-2-methylmalate dehydratase small subunit
MTSGHGIGKSIRGRVIKLAQNGIDTDVIAPGEWLLKGFGDPNLETLRPHVFESIRPQLNEIVKPGDVFVVGRNFGAGSHREAAVQIFQIWGVQAVIGESLARLWFRNAIAAGFPAFQLPGVTQMFDEGETIEIDLAAWTVSNPARDATRSIRPFPPTVVRMLEAGGMIALLKQRIAEHRAGEF